MLWDAELLRVSAFALPNNPFARVSLESLLGRPAEEITERPQANFRHEMATFEDAHVFLTNQLGRVDLLLGMVPSTIPNIGIVSVGPYDKVKTSYLDLAKQLIKNLGEVNRLAYAPTLVAQSPDQVSAYKVLASMLPFIKVDGERSRDLYWQINRPRSSRVLPGSEINRISKWSALRIQPFALQSDLTAVLSPPTVPPIFGVRVEIDVSTSAQGPVIPNRGMDAFDELISFADEIAEKGDIQ